MNAYVMIRVEAIVKRELKRLILDYRTSADASGDASKVVWYASVVFS
ncbi:hypothetical protein [Sulfurimonas sp. RIFOXYB12_FULL_35_9]|nr:hypothetical protein [Sulfurimonas sp. RIFOXYB12_FULL_35_9]